MIFYQRAYYHLKKHLTWKRQGVLWPGFSTARRRRRACSRAWASAALASMQRLGLGTDLLYSALSTAVLSTLGIALLAGMSLACRAILPDALPQALVLTAIVIGFGLLAFALALVLLVGSCLER